MAFEHNDNRGSIFRNNDRKSDNSPTHKGDAKVICPHCKEGFEVWISAWVNDLKTKAGKYFSLAFDHKEERVESSPPPAQQDFDDDIPF